MNIFAISDFHLSTNNPKPMDIFGPSWDNYLDDIVSDWKEKVGEEDIVLIAGDLSWAMKPADAEVDLAFFGTLPGYKVICRGNHDYWWSTVSKVRSMLPPKMYAVSNDAVKIGNAVICGSRLWTVPEPGKTQSEQDRAIYEHEIQRLTMSLDAGMKLLTEGDTMYAMVHYPPFNSTQKESDFTKIISSYPVKACVYGHLHGSAVRASYRVTVSGTDYYLTSCDLVANRLVKIQ